MDVYLNGSCHGYSTILHGAHFHHKLLHIYIQIVWAHFSNFFLIDNYKDGLEGKFCVCAWAQRWSSCTGNHQIIQTGQGPRRSLITAPVQSRVSFQIRRGYWGYTQIHFWKLQGWKQQSFSWATDLCARDGMLLSKLFLLPSSGWGRKHSRTICLMRKSSLTHTEPDLLSRPAVSLPFHLPVHSEMHKQLTLVPFPGAVLKSNFKSILV